MPRKLHSLPGSEVRVEIVFQFLHFTADAIDFAGRRIVRIGQAA